MSTPLISVVIPTYQHAASLPGCLESAFAQADVSLEVIVVDDGSTDNTREVLRPYAERITLLYQPNAGANPARNRGLAEAKGEFVIFCDADVIMQPGMLKTFVEALAAHPEASYAYSGFKFGWKLFPGVPFSQRQLRSGNFIHTTALVRRADFPGFDPAIRRFQDWDVWLTMLEQGKTGVLVPGVFFHVRIDGETRIGSSWLPSFVYKLPWHLLGWKPRRVQKYEDARRAIVEKHKL